MTDYQKYMQSQKNDTRSDVQKTIDSAFADDELNHEASLIAKEETYKTAIDDYNAKHTNDKSVEPLQDTSFLTTAWNRVIGDHFNSVHLDEVKDGKRYDARNKHAGQFDGWKLDELREYYKNTEENPNAESVVYTIQTYTGKDDNGKDVYSYKIGTAKNDVFERYMAQLPNGVKIIDQKRMAGAKDFEGAINKIAWESGKNKYDQSSGNPFGAGSTEITSENMLTGDKEGKLEKSLAEFDEVAGVHRDDVISHASDWREKDDDIIPVFSEAKDALVYGAGKLVADIGDMGLSAIGGMFNAIGIDNNMADDNFMRDLSKNMAKYTGYDEKASATAIAEATSRAKNGDFAGILFSGDLTTFGQQVLTSLPEMGLMFATGGGSEAIALASKANKAKKAYDAALLAGKVEEAAQLAKVAEASMSALKVSKAIKNEASIEKYLEMGSASRLMNKVASEYGFNAVVAKNTNNTIQERRNAGDKDVTILEGMSIAASSYMLAGIDKFGATEMLTENPLIRESMKKAWSVVAGSERKAIRNKIASMAKTISATGVAGATEAATEYVQTWGEILGKNVGVENSETGKKKSFLDVLGNDENQDEALGAAIAGGIGGAQMRGVADIYHGAKTVMTKKMNSSSDTVPSRIARESFKSQDDVNALMVAISQDGLDQDAKVEMLAPFAKAVELHFSDEDDHNIDGLDLKSANMNKDMLAIVVNKSLKGIAKSSNPSQYWHDHKGEFDVLPQKEKIYVIEQATKLFEKKERTSALKTFANIIMGSDTFTDANGNPILEDDRINNDFLSAEISTFIKTNRNKKSSLVGRFDKEIENLNTKIIELDKSGFDTTLMKRDRDNIVALNNHGKVDKTFEDVAREVTTNGFLGDPTRRSIKQYGFDVRAELSGAGSKGNVLNKLKVFAKSRIESASKKFGLNIENASAHMMSRVGAENIELYDELSDLNGNQEVKESLDMLEDAFGAMMNAYTGRDINSVENDASFSTHNARVATEQDLKNIESLIEIAKREQSSKQGLKAREKAFDLIRGGKREETDGSAGIFFADRETRNKIAKALIMSIAPRKTTGVEFSPTENAEPTPVSNEPTFEVDGVSVDLPTLTFINRMNEMYSKYEKVTGKQIDKASEFTLKTALSLVEAEKVSQLEKLTSKYRFSNNQLLSIIDAHNQKKYGSQSLQEAITLPKQTETLTSVITDLKGIVKILKNGQKNISSEVSKKIFEATGNKISELVAEGISVKEKIKLLDADTSVSVEESKLFITYVKKLLDRLRSALASMFARLDIIEQDKNELNKIFKVIEKYNKRLQKTGELHWKSVDGDNKALQTYEKLLEIARKDLVKVSEENKNAKPEEVITKEKFNEATEPPLKYKPQTNAKPDERVNKEDYKQSVKPAKEVIETQLQEQRDELGTVKTIKVKPVKELKVNQDGSVNGIIESLKSIYRGINNIETDSDRANIKTLLQQVKDVTLAEIEKIAQMKDDEILKQKWYKQSKIEALAEEKKIANGLYKKYKPITNKLMKQFSIAEKKNDTEAMFNVSYMAMQMQIQANKEAGFNVGIGINKKLSKYFKDETKDDILYNGMFNELNKYGLSKYKTTEYSIIKYIVKLTRNMYKKIKSIIAKSDKNIKRRENFISKIDEAIAQLDQVGYIDNMTALNVIANEMAPDIRRAGVEKFGIKIEEFNGVFESRPSVISDILFNESDMTSNERAMEISLSLKDTSFEKIDGFTIDEFKNTIIELKNQIGKKIFRNNLVVHNKTGEQIITFKNGKLNQLASLQQVPALQIFAKKTKSKKGEDVYYLDPNINTAITATALLMTAELRSVATDILTSDSKDLIEKYTFVNNEVDALNLTSFVARTKAVPLATISKTIRSTFKQVAGVSFPQSISENDEVIIMASIEAAVKEMLIGSDLTGGKIRFGEDKRDGKDGIDTRPIFIAPNTMYLTDELNAISNLNDDRAKKLVTKKPVVIESGKINNSNVPLAQYQIDDINRRNSKEHVFSSSMEEIMYMYNEDKITVMKGFGYKDITGEDALAYTATELKEIIDVNESLKREFDILAKNFVRIGKDNTFYLQHENTVSGRNQVSTELNTVNSKVHRELAIKKAFIQPIKTNITDKKSINHIDIENLSTSELFEIMIHQGFDKDPDKKGKHQVFKDVRELVDIYSTGSVKVKVPEPQTVTKTYKDIILETIQKGCK